MIGIEIADQNGEIMEKETIAVVNGDERGAVSFFG